MCHVHFVPANASFSIEREVSRAVYFVRTRSWNGTWAHFVEELLQAGTSVPFAVNALPTHADWVARSQPRGVAIQMSE